MLSERRTQKLHDNIIYYESQHDSIPRYPTSLNSSSYSSTGSGSRSSVRVGRLGAPWKHITQCTGNRGEHICFVDETLQPREPSEYEITDPDQRLFRGLRHIQQTYGTRGNPITSVKPPVSSKNLEYLDSRQGRYGSWRNIQQTRGPHGNHLAYVHGSGVNLYFADPVRADTMKQRPTSPKLETTPYDRDDRDPNGAPRIQPMSQSYPTLVPTNEATKLKQARDLQRTSVEKFRIQQESLPKLNRQAEQADNAAAPFTAEMARQHLNEARPLLKNQEEPLLQNRNLSDKDLTRYVRQSKERNINNDNIYKQNPDKLRTVKRMDSLAYTEGPENYQKKLDLYTELPYLPKQTGYTRTSHPILEPKMYTSRPSVRNASKNNSVYHERAKKNFKYWPQGNKGSQPAKTTIQGKLMAKGIGM